MDPSLLRIRDAALLRMQTDWRQQADSPTHHERLHADSGAGQSTPGECIRHFLSTPPAVESQESQPSAEKEQENPKLERKNAKSEIAAEESSVLAESEVEEMDEPPEIPVLKRPAAQGSGGNVAKKPATAKTKVAKRPAASMTAESKAEGDGGDGEQGHRVEKKPAPATAKTKAANKTAAPKKSEAEGGGGDGGQGHRVDKKPAAAEPSHKDDFVYNPRAFPNAVRSFVDDTGNWQARFLKAVLFFFHNMYACKFG